MSLNVSSIGQLLGATVSYITGRVQVFQLKDMSIMTTMAQHQHLLAKGVYRVSGELNARP